MIPILLTGTTVTFSSIAGSPEDNTALKEELDDKVGYGDFALTLNGLNWVKRLEVSTDSDQMTNGLIITGAFGDQFYLTGMLNMADDSLTTTQKSIKGAINELNSDKAEKSEIPTKTSELQNDSNYITGSYIHTVRFLNADNTVLKKAVVVNGDTSFYDGATPEYTGTDAQARIFIGWEPSLDTPVMADTDFVAQYLDTDFSTASWNSINFIANECDGYVNANNQWCILNGQGLETPVFNVGDEKTITLSDGETIYAQIYGFQHDDKVSGGKASLTIGLKTLMTAKGCMNLVDTNSGGWGSSYMRNTVLTGIYNKLPEDLKGYIKTVYKKAVAGLSSTTIVTYEDKVWLLAVPEINETAARYTGEGTAYPIFTGSTSRKKKYPNNEYGAWWLRSPKATDNKSFNFINTSGVFDGDTNDPASDMHGICFCFCI